MNVSAESPDLSIIIPVFRETLKLANTLKSFQVAFAKSDLSFEVILVDNNSPNITEILATIDEFRWQMPIIVVLQPKLPHTFALCSARNRGVETARGRHVFFTDADCMIDARFVDDISRVLSDEPSDSSRIYTGERVFVEIPDRSLNSIDFIPGFPELKRVPSKSNYGKVKDRRFPWITRLPEQEHPWNFVHGCHILLNRQDYLAVGGSDLSYDGHWGYEEIDLVYRMVQELKSQVFYLEKSKVYHQESQADLDDMENVQRVSKSKNPNYQRICRRIPGYEEFKRATWKQLGIKTS